jgi:UrcA family protein
MNQKILATIATGGMTLFASGAFGQAMEVVTVEAVREIFVGTSTIGAPIKELSIRSRVSYADLDLTTDAGVSTLKKRVKDAATSACNDIKVDNPIPGWTVDRCIKDAVNGTMPQIEKAVEAEKAAKK